MDAELYNELCKAYQYAAPYIQHSRFAIAYLSRADLLWSIYGGWVLDTATGELVIHVQSGIILPELQSNQTTFH